MKKKRSLKKYALLVATIIIVSMMFFGCDADIVADDPPVDTQGPPTVASTFPDNASTGANVNGTITATFDDTVDPATINEVTFTVSSGGVDILGVVTYDAPNKKAIFAPTANLDYVTEYTATLSTGVETIGNTAMTEDKVWAFTTAADGIGPAPVNLRTAANYVILAKTAISTVPDSIITGDIGLSPAAESYMTGFSQTDATGYATSFQVNGFLYAADMVTPTSSNLTTAVSDMELAYTDAAGRSTPDELNLGSGEIGGLSLVPGLYKWTSSVSIGSDVTITGGANDTWIFQIDGDLGIGNGFNVILAGGAQAKNIVWQVAGEVSMGTGSHFEGIVLCQTQIVMNTSASMNGRLLAQSNVALDHATVTNPAL